MKPGRVDETKTRSAGNRLPAGKRYAAAFVLLTVWLVQAACAGGMVSPLELTATAGVPAPSVVNPTEPGTVVSGATLLPQPQPTEPADSPGSMIFVPYETATPTPLAIAQADPQLPIEPQPETPPTLEPAATQLPPILYYTQAGDTLKALAARFNVVPEEITSPDRIPTTGLFDPGILLLIPPRLGDTSSSQKLLPDSELVYSPSALDIDLEQFVNESGGYLGTYKEWRSNGWYDGPSMIQRVAIENSVNPRLLLAVLEHQSNWVYGNPGSQSETDYPIGWLLKENEQKGLYYQLSWAVQQFNTGYYGWRDGTVTELTFKNGEKLRLAPDLNAGTVALLYMYSRLYDRPQWEEILYGENSLMALHEKMFGNPWLRASTNEPLFPATLTQPPMELPFAPGRTWSLTGGPHSAWLVGKLSEGGARAALDFAPSASEHGCYKSNEKATAVSSGLVVRSGNGLVVLDMDGDGYEQTGWAILYLHIASEGRVPVGTWVNLNDPIGYPSCEGGPATGTHVHIARKYNGEWILADGPMPFVLTGWRAHAYPEPYMGYMTKGDQTIYSSLVGSHESLVTRPK